MTINWQGFSSFKIQEKNDILLIDPIEKIFNNLTAEEKKVSICLLSSLDFLTYDQKIIEAAPHIFKYPGEYEVNDISLRISDSLGPEGKRNNIFSIRWQGIHIVHLGLLKQKNSISKIVERVNGADILMIPIGGNTVLEASDAIEIVHQIEPNIVIPMFYKTDEKNNFKLNDAQYFIQEMGQEQEILETLKIEKQDINLEKTKLIILKP